MVEKVVLNPSKLMRRDMTVLQAAKKINWTSPQTARLTPRRPDKFLRSFAADQ